ncbi:MAG: hypothetical protein FWG11_00830, partial [Promicromonosporaceae bacterium]|nr:hypothetical protein [Promicromonosporaceae bacterium]
ESRHNLHYWRGDDWWGIGPGAHSYLRGPVSPPPAPPAGGAPTSPVDAAPASLVEERSAGSRLETKSPPKTRTQAATGSRWWNVKHPRRYAALLTAGELPIEGRETLTAADDALERVMLRLRLREGLPVEALSEAGRAAIPDLIAQGLITLGPIDDPAVAGADGTGGPGHRIVLTRRGRLLADAVTHELTG